MLDAIVIGMGPSFFEWIKIGPKDNWSYDPKLKVRYYGSGKVSKFPIPLTGYFYACPPKRDQVPSLRDIDVYARHEVWEPGMILWPDNIPRGGSAGSMALSWACNQHEHIGLIGFDGFGMPDYFLSEFRGLLRYWKSKGKKLYTLMSESMFDDLLEKPDVG